MRGYKDTPKCYIYDGIWGMSAFTALWWIREKRRHYRDAPQRWKDEIEQDRRHFVEALKRANTKPSGA